MELCSVLRNTRTTVLLTGGNLQHPGLPSAPHLTALLALRPSTALPVAGGSRVVPDRGCVFLLQEQTPWDIASQTLRGTQSTAASRTISQHKNQGVLWGGGTNG